MRNPEGLSTEYDGRCRNCHGFMGEDEYCRFCGTKRDGAEFEPGKNIMAPVYGSPFVSRKYKCKSCGKKFTGTGMSGGLGEYCFECKTKVNRQTTDYNLAVSPHTENITAKKLLAQCILLFESHMEGYSAGERAGGSIMVTYRNHIIEENVCSYGGGGKGGVNTQRLVIPQEIQYEEDLIKYVVSKKPEWAGYLKSYCQRNYAPDKVNKLFGTVTTETGTKSVYKKPYPTDITPPKTKGGFPWGVVGLALICVAGLAAILIKSL